jgi:hypothetical protein
MQKFLQFIILTFIFSSTCFGRPLAHHHELNNCNSILWFYLRSVVKAVLLTAVGPASQHVYLTLFNITLRSTSSFQIILIPSKFCVETLVRLLLQLLSSS